MHRVSNSVLPSIVAALALVLAGFGVSAVADPGGETVRAEAGAAKDLSASMIERTVRVDDGIEFDRLMLQAGYSEAEVEELRDRQRAVAIRMAYANDDRWMIEQIEAQLPAEMIEAALAAPEEPENLGQSWVVYNCGAGVGVTARFRIFVHWTAYFKTTTGAKTSTQNGNCGDIWNGCLVTDSISGHPAITWQSHWVNAHQVGAHEGWCN